jgi:folate-dependent phosphoribosylglycinamide formyltransferase PurN
MENKKIVLLVGKGQSSNIVFHALNTRFNVHSVIMEEKESKTVLIKRRIKKLGMLQVTGQIMFQLAIVPLLNLLSKKETAQFLDDHKLPDTDIPVNKIMHVASINESVVAETIATIQPAVIVVNGTRIISKKILAAINCPCINTHAGITPMYRGVHGAYWALVNKDPEHCGVTVHLVDTGIDTGAVLYQSLISVDKEDTFVTYPVKQLAAGIPILIQAIEDALNEKLITTKPNGKSELWYHPAIWQYVYNRFKKNVK